MTEKKYEDVEAQFWNYENKGDFVAGIYLSNQSEVGENKSMVYNLEQPDGKIISIWGSKVLDTKMKLLKISDDVKIIYLGLVKAEGKNREYKNFQIQKATPEIENPMPAGAE